MYASTAVTIIGGVAVTAMTTLVATSAVLTCVKCMVKHAGGLAELIAIFRRSKHIQFKIYFVVID